MDKSPLALLDLIERLGHLIRAELRRIGQEHRLQVVHLQALAYLARANRYSNTPQALGEFFSLTKGTVSQSLLLLDRRGLIERYEDEVDRRVVRLRLSPLGEQLVNESLTSSQWMEATREISANRVRNGVSVLRETLFMMQLDNGGRTFGVCQSCAYLQKESQRVYRCGLMGDRLTVPETRRICREHSPKSSDQPG